MLRQEVLSGGSAAEVSIELGSHQTIASHLPFLWKFKKTSTTKNAIQVWGHEELAETVAF